MKLQSSGPGSPGAPEGKQRFVAVASKLDLKYLNGVGEGVSVKSPKVPLEVLMDQSEVHEIRTANVKLSSTLAVWVYHAAVAISTRRALKRNVGSRTRAPSASD